MFVPTKPSIVLIVDFVEARVIAQLPITTRNMCSAYGLVQSLQKVCSDDSDDDMISRIVRPALGRGAVNYLRVLRPRLQTKI